MDLCNVKSNHSGGLLRCKNRSIFWQLVLKRLWLAHVPQGFLFNGPNIFRKDNGLKRTLPRGEKLLNRSMKFSVSRFISWSLTRFKRVDSRIGLQLCWDQWYNELMVGTYDPSSKNFLTRLQRNNCPVLRYFSFAITWSKTANVFYFNISLQFCDNAV